ncbi:MAG: DUF2752 domain-containing protein [Chitinophagaceae bacterium]|nr:DUF2752 domain-containing protein [Chitinophagaceae bacterium]
MKRAVALVVPAAIISGILLFYFLFDARKTTWLPQCPFHLLTGFYCPGCGSQRALSSILHGEFLQALRFNVLLIASLPLLMYSATVMIVNKTTGNHIVQKFFYSASFGRIVLIVILAFWFLRNLPFFPFTSLSPNDH